MKDVLDTLALLPPWMLWANLALGTLALLVAFTTWQKSWAGSGYKGITGAYWIRLVLLLAIGLAAVAASAGGLVSR